MIQSCQSVICDAEQMRNATLLFTARPDTIINDDRHTRTFTFTATMQTEYFHITSNNNKTHVERRHARIGPDDTRLGESVGGARPIVCPDRSMQFATSQRSTDGTRAFAPPTRHWAGAPPSFVRPAAHRHQYAYCLSLRSSLSRSAICCRKPSLGRMSRRMRTVRIASTALIFFTIIR